MPAAPSSASWAMMICSQASTGSTACPFTVRGSQATVFDARLAQPIARNEAGQIERVAKAAALARRAAGRRGTRNTKIGRGRVLRASWRKCLLDAPRHRFSTASVIGSATSKQKATGCCSCRLSPARESLASRRSGRRSRPQNPEQQPHRPPNTTNRSHARMPDVHPRSIVRRMIYAASRCASVPPSRGTLNQGRTQHPCYDLLYHTIPNYRPYSDRKNGRRKSFARRMLRQIAKARQVQHLTAIDAMLALVADP